MTLNSKKGKGQNIATQQKPFSLKILIKRENDIMTPSLFSRRHTEKSQIKIYFPNILIP